MFSPCLYEIRLRTRDCFILFTEVKKQMERPHQVVITLITYYIVP